MILTVSLCMQAAVLNAKGVNPEGKVRPSVLALSRQGMPNLPGTSKEGVLKGGYIVQGGDAKPDVIFIATGACILESWSASPLPYHGVRSVAGIPAPVAPPLLLVPGALDKEWLLCLYFSALLASTWPMSPPSPCCLGSFSQRRLKRAIVTLVSRSHWPHSG